MGCLTRCCRVGEGENESRAARGRSWKLPDNSRHTAKRAWSFARAWLFREIKRLQAES